MRVGLAKLIALSICAGAAASLQPARTKSLRGQCGLDRLNYLRRIRCDLGFKTPDDLAVAPNQELGEIPLDIPWCGRVFTGQLHIQRVSVRPVDLELVKYRERYVIGARA